MRTRIYNARILTMEEDRKIFKGEIQIEDGRISCVKPCDGDEVEVGDECVRIRVEKE